MLLCNVHIVGKKGVQHVEVTGDKITAVSKADEYSIDRKENETQIEFRDAIAFPGLINSHDHLDFNLFRQTGNRIYNNYAEWAKDIHQQNKESINAVLKVPQHLRTQWGMYKNLLNGLTTVVNHGHKLNIPDDFISVLQNNYNLHSIQFEKNWKLKLNNPFIKRQPYVIHIGEGTDDTARREIDELIQWNFLKRIIIGVHGVAMNDEQAGHFKALIWCPASNDFLFNSTAAVDELKTKTSILFGTDSTLSSGWNLWEQLRLARDTLLMTDKELFDALTKNAAAVWKRNNIASIDIDKQANIIIADAHHKTGFNAFFSLNPEDLQLVMHKGEIRLFDIEIKNQLIDKNISYTGFTKICINRKEKYVYGNLPALMNEIWSYYPKASFPVSTQPENMKT